MLESPLVRCEVSIDKKQGSSVQVKADTKAAFITNPSTNETGGNRRR
jgi:hypothetical protein